jgi:hypothetical protein
VPIVITQIRLTGSGNRAVAQQGAKACHHLLHPERFGHIVIGAVVQRTYLFGFSIAHRKHQYRHSAPLAQLGQYLMAFPIRQAQIEDHEIGCPGRRQGEPLFGSAGL